MTYTIKADVVGPGEAPKRTIQVNIAGVLLPHEAKKKFEGLYTVAKYHWVKQKEEVKK